jgi:hypothetical protein
VIKLKLPNVLPSPALLGFQNQAGYFDKNVVKQILRDRLIQKWHSEIIVRSVANFTQDLKIIFVLKTIYKVSVNIIESG